MKIRWNTGSCLISIFLLFSSPKLFSQQTDTCYVKDSLMVTLENGHTVCVSYAACVTTLEPRLPVQLMFNIYAAPFTKEDIISFQQSSQKKGYAYVEVNTRGKRCSNDSIDPFVHDAEDGYYVIDWISKQPWCNGKIGIKGGSYLGFAQWAMMKRIHPALKTIVPQVSVAPGFDFPSENGIFMSYCLQWIHYVTDNKHLNYSSFEEQGTWDSLYYQWYRKGLPFADLDSFADGKRNSYFQRWIKHPNYDEFWKKMIPQGEDFAGINIPILSITGNWDDDQNGALYYYRQHHTLNRNANHYLVFGPYDHAGAQYTMRDTLFGLPIEKEGILKFTPFIDKWFNWILKDSSKPEFLRDKVNYYVFGRREWKHASSLENMYSRKYELQVSNGGLRGVSGSKPISFVQTVNFKDRSIAVPNNTGIMAFPRVLLDSLVVYPWQSKFETTSFDQEFELAGNYAASIDVVINKRDFDFTIDWYELLPNGQYIALNHISQRASYWKDRSKRTLFVPGKITHINVKNTFLTSKLIGKGSKLVMVIGPLYNPVWQINYGTGKDVSKESIKDAGIPLKVEWKKAVFEWKIN